MKKIIICGIAAALCASALTTSAFATDIIKDTSIIAGNAEELASTAKKLEEGISLDPKTIMPVYYADTNDYISTGKLKLSDVNKNGYRRYFCDLINNKGDFLGVAFAIENSEGNLEVTQYYLEYADPSVVGEGIKQCSSVDFRLYSDEVKSLLLANNIDPDVKDVKLLSFHDIGVAYYINNGTDEVLVRARGVEEIFDWNVDSDIVVLNEQFRQKAAHIVEENNKDLDDAYGAGGNGANPNTGSDTSKHTAALAVELGLISAMIIGGAVVSKKRKNER